MFGNLFRRSQPEKGQGDGQPDLEAAIKTIKDIPKLCDQMRTSLETSYGHFEEVAREYFETRDKYVQEVAQLVHVKNSYKGVPGHEGDFVRAKMCIQNKLRQIGWEIEVKRDVANTAFRYYQQTLNVARDSYENVIRPLLQVPELESAIQDAEQKVKHWAGK